MSDEFLLSLRHSLHHLYDVARTLSWLHFLPLTILSVVIFLLPGCGDNHGNKTVPVRTVRYVVVGSAQTLPALERTGEIHAHDETILSFRTGGRIVTRSVDIGDRVNAGQLLATLENTTSQNQLDGAQADYEGAKASAQVAALNVSRMQKLMPTGAIARTQLDNARADWLVARARLKNSESALRNARENLGWTRLIAPQSGMITEVSASAGQVVSGGQSVLTLATGEARDVVFDIAKPDAIPPQEQAGLRVSLLSDPSVQASAALRDISPQAEPQTRTWRVRATLQNPPLAMALGASVTVTLPATGPHGYALPASALSRVGDKPAVYVINPQSQAQLRVVVPAYYTATSVIISGGLEPGDRVITAGVSKLRSGEPVIAGECES
ncbi:TPA: efflux RND transporter periplasmic adaptor subunit [Klebsiella quasipneumoniae subsp. similipneumoniae]|mgnify:FL=1|uniref:efflux RND transporter periplasmic adaptor subunit n=1 Tax=Klebsiella quasipneumoniae TaxID=1463165 RepID=UPI000B955469|nr:efflux RND transporter periplasmic adaptor subunit [Klebsiella quasipneumoniae]AZR63162.1 efflux RND transporter periplasmic adaptor subunit [Klebsiella quasipneumoniae]MDS7677955.1 efflux RND transporter periplasmic adaptor subunit [Klebsiella quasipneumoniae]OYF86098.1 efflux transporter periplasmic adaptor subunit [Klebsiella quasipneumoniae subsp. similipneumoniae]HCM6591561.1 efflux RND transporter periplasmic adaptor subunit [Klebsiella quasipneumoniae]HCM6593257.1 efflux RND transpor